MLSSTHESSVPQYSMYCFIFVKRQFSVGSGRKFDIQWISKVNFESPFSIYILKDITSAPALQNDLTNKEGRKLFICKHFINQALCGNFVLVFGQRIVFPGHFGLISVYISAWERTINFTPGIPSRHSRAHLKYWTEVVISMTLFFAGLGNSICFITLIQ